MKKIVLTVVLIILLIGACVVAGILYSQITKIGSEISELNEKCERNDKSLINIDKKADAEDLNERIDSLSSKESEISEITNKILPVLFEAYKTAGSSGAYKSFITYDDMVTVLGREANILDSMPGSGIPVALWAFDIPSTVTNPNAFKKLNVSVHLSNAPESCHTSYVTSVHLSLATQ